MNFTLFSIDVKASLDPSIQTNDQWIRREIVLKYDTTQNANLKTKTNLTVTLGPAPAPG